MDQNKITLSNDVSILEHATNILINDAYILNISRELTTKGVVFMVHSIDLDIFPAGGEIDDWINISDVNDFCDSNHSNIYPINTTDQYNMICDIMSYYGATNFDHYPDLVNEEDFLTTYNIDLGDYNF